MTLNKPEPGEQFGHPEQSGPLTFVGRLSDGRWVLETMAGDISNLSAKVAACELFPYLEPVEPLERGQLFQRTRNDYAGTVAEVLAVFEGQHTFSADQTFDSTWVAYHQHGGAGSREPKLKDEISFRRIFGRRVESVDRPVT